MFVMYVTEGGRNYDPVLFIVSTIKYVCFYRILLLLLLYAC